MKSHDAIADSQAYKSDFAAMGLAQSVWDTKRPKAPDVILTREEKNRIQTRERAQKNRAIELATRVNAESNIGCSTSGFDAKAARLVGKRNEARSQ